MNQKLFTLALIILAMTGCLPSEAAHDEVCFKNRCVLVEVVSDDRSMARGLQFRSHLAEHEGMLFVFPESGIYPFWMKDTLIALDLIWLDDSGKVIEITKGAPPCRSNPCPTYASTGEIRYVLEVNAGYTDRMDIAPGAQAELRIRRKN